MSETHEIAKPLSGQSASGGEKPALAPLMLRVAAFAIDVVAMGFLGYSLNMFAGRWLLELGPMLPWVTTLGVFAYVWLGNGPLGNGTTLGKAIINLRVVDREGVPLSFSASLRRAALLFPLPLPATVGLFCEGLEAPLAISLFLNTFAWNTAIILLIGVFFSMMINPHRRGWHDQWSGSFVTFDPLPPAYRTLISELDHEGVEQSVRSTRKISIIFTAIAAVVVFGQAFLKLSTLNSESGTISKLVDELNRDGLIEGYRLEGIRFPEADEASLYQDHVRQLREAIAGTEVDSTTDTLRQKFGLVRDGRTAILVFKKQFGAVSQAEASDAKLVGDVSELYANWKEIESNVPDSIEREPTERLFIQLHSPFIYLFFPMSRDFITVDAGVDVSRDEIELRWVDLARTKADAKALKATIEASVRGKTSRSPAANTPQPAATE